MDNGNSHVLRFKFSITPSDLFLGCPKFNTSAAPCEMPNVLPLDFMAFVFLSHFDPVVLHEHVA